MRKGLETCLETGGLIKEKKKKNMLSRSRGMFLAESISSQQHVQGYCLRNKIAHVLRVRTSSLHWYTLSNQESFIGDSRYIALALQARLLLHCPNPTTGTSSSGLDDR